MKDFNCALQIEPYNIDCLYMVDLIKAVNVSGIKKLSFIASVYLKEI